MLKSNHTNKWYMHNPESVQENETHKLLCDFEIKMDQVISVRGPCVVIFSEKKGNLPNSGLCRPN